MEEQLFHYAQEKSAPKKQCQWKKCERTENSNFNRNLGFCFFVIITAGNSVGPFIGAFCKFFGFGAAGNVLCYLFHIKQDETFQ